MIGALAAAAANGLSFPFSFMEIKLAFQPSSADHWTWSSNLTLARGPTKDNRTAADTISLAMQ